MEGPDYWNRNCQNKKVRNNACYSVADIESGDINTTSMHFWISKMVPEIAERSALDNKDDIGRDPPSDDEEEDNVSEVSERRHFEDSIIKEYNRQLGQ